MLTVSYTRSKSEDRLNHWFSPENSADPELDRGPTGADTPHNLVTSGTWNIPGSGPVLSGWRLSAVSHHQSGSPYTIRYAGDPTGGGLTGGCSIAGMPVEPARRSQHGARQVHQLRGSDACPEPSRWDPTRSRFAPTCSTCSTTRTSSRAATSALVGNPRFGQHAGGANVFPGRQFQFAATYRF